MKTKELDLSNQADAMMIIDGCIKGDRSCQSLLYEAMYGKMLGVCMRYASNSDEAKDFLHDGFLKVFKKIKCFKHTGSFEGWIRRIIVNTTIDTLRKKKKMQFNSDSEDSIMNLTDDSEPTLVKQNQTNIDAGRIIEMIQDLSPAYKTVFNLYVIEDYSHKEIAETLGISIGTSKSNLAKAKQKLRNFYTEKYGNINAL